MLGRGFSRLPCVSSLGSLNLRVGVGVGVGDGAGAEKIGIINDPMTIIITITPSNFYRKHASINKRKVKKSKIGPSN